MPAPDHPDRVRTTPSRLPRRGLLLLGGAAVASLGAAAGLGWFNVLARNEAGTLTPHEAHAAAASGELLLIDIRRPDEWARTGLGEHAIPLDMRRADLASALLAAAQGDTSRKVALICARGVRSRRLGAALADAGFSAVLDVPEGMLGSGAGPGWIGRGLPVVAAAVPRE